MALPPLSTLWDEWLSNLDTSECAGDAGIRDYTAECQEVIAKVAHTARLVKNDSDKRHVNEVSTRAQAAITASLSWSQVYDCGHRVAPEGHTKYCLEAMVTILDAPGDIRKAILTSEGRPAPATTRPTTTTTTPPKTPAEQLNEQAKAAGITVPYGRATSIAAMVQYACESLPREKDDTHRLLSLSQWTHPNSLSTGPDEQIVAIYRLGLPMLCPQYLPLLEQAITGEGVPFLVDSPLEVGQNPGQIKPGKYTNLDAVDDCYWERTSKSGQILDNNFASHAVERGMTVTVRASDGSFTAKRCGFWLRVR